MAALLRSPNSNGGRLLVIYNLHLESRGNEGLRLLQLDEVLADAKRYGQDGPVIVVGDFNTQSRRSPLIDRLNQAGYRSSFGDRRLRTHILIGDLDWVFFRGPIRSEDARVIRHARSSDHFPIALDVRF